MAGAGLSPVSAPVKSTCPYCGVGCGVLLTPGGAGGLAVQGDPDHPAILGRLCSQGTQLGQTTGLDDRLLAPTVTGTAARWGTTLDLASEKFTAAVRDHGREAVAF